jgi:hypothetical protein
MIEPKKKKITTRRVPRRTTNGAISVKRRLNEETPHIINLKKPIINHLELSNNQASVIPAKLAFKKSSAASHLYKKLSITFIVLAIIILSVVGYFALVRLDIKVVPKVLPIAAKASFTIYDRPDNYTLPAGSILGLVREMDIEYKGTTPASDEKVIGAEVSGKVTIINKYIKDQPLVATTRLLTSTNQLLRLKDSVVVPAGGSIEANVYGDSTDPSFTLADSKLTIPGLWAGLQDKIYAEAKAGEVSYREKKQATVTQSDLDQAVATAKKALLDKAAADIETTYAAYDEKLYQLDDQSIAFSFDAKPGDQKAEVNITMSAKVIVVAFKKDSLANLNQTTLESAVGQGQSIVEDSSTTPSFKIISADTKQNIANVELDVDGSSSALSPEDLVDRQKIVGLNDDQIKNYLNSLPNIESYELHFSPSFIKIAPQLVDRISVTIK